MTIKNRVNGSNRDTQEHVVERRSTRLVFSVLTAGLVLGILAAGVGAYAARYSSLAQALDAETSPVFGSKDEWYGVDDPSKIPANIALGENPETSSALDIDWYGVDDPSKIPANIALGQNPETSSALDIDWYGVDDPSKLPVRYEPDY